MALTDFLLKLFQVTQIRMIKFRKIRVSTKKELKCYSGLRWKMKNVNVASFSCRNMCIRYKIGPLQFTVAGNSFQHFSNNYTLRMNTATVSQVMLL